MSDSFGIPMAAMRALGGGVVFAMVGVASIVGTVVPRMAVAQVNSPAFTGPRPSSTPADRPATDPQTPRGENPGLINEIGKLWDKSSSMLPSLRSPGGNPAASPQEDPAPAPPTAAPVTPASPPAEAPPVAAPTPSLVPSMVSGRAPCPAAGNGAPDCKLGADRLCQSKGFASGKGLSSDSVEACSAKRLLPGRERKPEDCRMDYFVTRAFCQ
jgi:hypothetical protein